MSFLQLSEDWDYKYIDSILGGINREKPAKKLEDTELVQAENVYFNEGLIKVDTGYTAFGGTVRGNPRGTYQFYKTDGTSELLLITDDTFYKYNSSEWQYVSDGTSTTTVNDETAGNTVIEVNSTTGFNPSDYIALVLSDGTQHQTTIASVSAGVSITIDDAIPAGKNTGVGGIVIKAVDLAGSLDIQLSVVTVPSHNWFVFTNGVDQPQRYDGTDCTDIPNLPSSGNTTCRLVALFNDYLILAHSTEGGTKYPQRVRWSDTADPTNWSTGNAGYRDLYDTEDFLIAVNFLGPYIIFYRERSIVRGSYVGSEDLLFDFETTVTGEGALSQDSVVNLGDIHIFIGNANVYEYRGGFDVTPIGDKIYYDVFGTSGELNPGYKQRVFCLYVEEQDEVWIFYPHTGQEKPKKLLRYSQENEAWLKRTFSHDISGFGLYQSTTERTWNDLVGDWTQQSWTWDSRAVEANAPTTHLCSVDNLQVYEYDYITLTDNGTAISYTVETKDFGHPKFQIRFDSYDFRLKGNSVLVEYSTDGGETWIELGTITSSTIAKNKLSKQVVSDFIRFKLTGSDAFNLESFGFMYIHESEFSL